MLWVTEAVAVAVAVEEGLEEEGMEEGVEEKAEEEEEEGAGEGVGDDETIKNKKNIYETFYPQIAPHNIEDLSPLGRGIQL